MKPERRLPVTAALVVALLAIGANDRASGYRLKPKQIRQIADWLAPRLPNDR